MQPILSSIFQIWSSIFISGNLQYCEIHFASTQLLGAEIFNIVRLFCLFSFKSESSELRIYLKVIFQIGQVIRKYMQGQPDVQIILQFFNFLNFRAVGEMVRGQNDRFY